MSTKTKHPTTFLERIFENFGKMAGMLVIALSIGLLAFAIIYFAGHALGLDDPFKDAEDAMRIIGFLSFFLPWCEFLLEGLSLSWHRGKRRAEGGE